eukprot:9480884-Pyramimonas_sp.AAC.1
MLKDDVIWLIEGGEDLEDSVSARAREGVCRILVHNGARKALLLQPPRSTGLYCYRVPPPTSQSKAMAMVGQAAAHRSAASPKVGMPCFPHGTEQMNTSLACCSRIAVPLVQSHA